MSEHQLAEHNLNEATSAARCAFCKKKKKTKTKGRARRGLVFLKKAESPRLDARHAAKHVFSCCAVVAASASPISVSNINTNKGWAHNPVEDVAVDLTVSNDTA